MAVSILASKILAAGAGALAGYLMYKPEKKQGGNNSGKSKKNKDWFVPKVDLNSGAAVMNAVTVEAYKENSYEFGRVLVGTVTDERVNRPYYYGDRNKPYDPFYDYTDTTDKELLTQGGELAAPFHFVRARILPEYFAYDKEFVPYLGFYKKTSGWDGWDSSDYWCEELRVNGWKVGVRFRVELFNPGLNPIKISHLGIEQVEINGIAVQPFYATYVGQETDPQKQIDDKAHWNFGYYENKNGSFFTKVGGYRGGMEAFLVELMRGIKEDAWNGFYYPKDYTPENIPAQGSLFQDWFLPNLWPIDSLLSIKDIERNAYYYIMTNPPAENLWSKSDGGSFFVKMKFASGGEDSIVEAALWRGARTYGEKLPARAWTEYIGSDVFTNLFTPINYPAATRWQELKDKYNAAFDSSFGVDMASYWYLWAKNKAALDSKIKSLLGVSGNDYWVPTTSPIQKKRLLDKVGEAGSEKRKQVSDLLVLYKNVFKSTALTITEAENTYKEAYKNDVTKGVTLLPSLKYWAEQAAGAAPGTSSRTSTSRTSTSRTSTSRTSTSSRTGSSTRGVNGMTSGYNAISM